LKKYSVSDDLNMAVRCWNM